MPSKKPPSSSTTSESKAKRKVKNQTAPSPGPAQVANDASAALLGFQQLVGGNQVNQSDTLIGNIRGYLVTTNRNLLSQAYVEHGIIKTAVNVPVEDGLRGGVTIKSEDLSPDEIQVLAAKIERSDVIHSVVGMAHKWNRLFGGAAILIGTKQKSETPLDINAISDTNPAIFKAVDLWELMQDVSVDDVAEGAHANNSHFQYAGQRWDRSRVMLLKGEPAPSFVRQRLRGWGLSIVESIINSVSQYLKTNNLVFEVLDEFKVDYFKIKGLTNTILSSDGHQAIQRRMQVVNQTKNFQQAVVMDSEDDFVQKMLSFAGLADVPKEVRMQIASDLRMPLSKVFGISATGFSSGEDDIENYNSMVEGSIRSKAKREIIKIVEIMSQEEFGYVPEDIQIEFQPLRVLSSEQQENVKTQKFARLIQTRQAGEISTKEFKDALNKDDLLPIKIDASLETLEMPGQEPKPGEKKENSGGKPPPFKNKETLIT